jgi:lycopene cyclase domain-containing protein
MPEYTVAAILGVIAVVAYELRIARTGIFRRRAYWITMAICAFFMVLVNGWLTKLSAPIVRYDPEQKTPWRFPVDIPVEDFLFGFALLTLVLILWVRAGTTAEAPAGEPEATQGADPSDDRSRR